MPREPAGYPFSMRDLNKRAADPTVKAALSAWARGRYPNFEAALIGLAVMLCDDKARLQKRVMEMLRDRPDPKKGPDTKR